MKPTKQELKSAVKDLMNSYEDTCTLLSYSSNLSAMAQKDFIEKKKNLDLLIDKLFEEEDP